MYSKKSIIKWYDWYRNIPLQYLKNISALGYDGFIVNKVEGIKHGIVFNPQKIKIISMKQKVDNITSILENLEKDVLKESMFSDSIKTELTKALSQKIVEIAQKSVKMNKKQTVQAILESLQVLTNKYKTIYDQTTEKSASKLK